MVVDAGTIASNRLQRSEVASGGVQCWRSDERSERIRCLDDERVAIERRAESPEIKKASAEAGLSH